MGSTDIKFSGEIFRKDHPMILAARRDLASIKPVRLAFQTDGYVAGTVLGRNSVSGYYQAYTDAGASGQDTAVGVLFEKVEEDLFASSGDTRMARMIAGGEVFEDKLTGLDAAAKTDLGSRSIVDATGVTILKF